MKIELNNYDLQIKEVKTTDGVYEVVQIRNAMAFNPDFIEEMKLSGVRKYEERDDKGETGA